MIQILDKEIFDTLKMEFKKCNLSSIHWDLNHWLTHRDIKEALWKEKNRAIKLRYQEWHMTSSLLIFSPEVNLTLELYIRFNYLQAG